MDLGEPPVLPVLRLPEAPQLPRPVLEVPRAEIPSYKPLVVPPSDLRPPPGVKGTTESDKENQNLSRPSCRIYRQIRGRSTSHLRTRQCLFRRTKYLSRLALLPPSPLQPPSQQQQSSNGL
ncbi:hypothetical protein STIP37_45 [Synechococcus T7-like phage S-TIP37]|uniref:Uncharacterized protein n=1 Tax=Synechococcus T7-like phage S-TIP37 TaxID=1332145 RepID=A0A345AYD6_9CAUD|nr:hypothetical protein HOT80_gp46 [Synechococcus T7-like phage S-TIP37]AXF42116.1 hypothetical protein STIP37_45 [Synechococcus T7-like phage S-TIP37]